MGLCAGAVGAELIDAKRYDFSLTLDIRYATPRNFTKQTVYPMARCFLRPPVAQALSRVQAALKLRGLGLKIFDCYRPLAVQKKFWALVPDERYVADPAKGSRHNRGAAVDVTLIDRERRDVPMPSEYDDFTEKAHRDYRPADAGSEAKGFASAAVKNREILEKAMVAEGFEPLATEWWHFDFKGWEQYPIEDIPFEQLARRK